MKKTHNTSFAPAIGGTSLLVIFSVICLSVFSVLSLISAQSGQRLAEKNAASAAGYYQADTSAEQIFAQLRSGADHEAVIWSGNQCSYAVPISPHQTLLVQLQTSQHGWTVQKWQVYSHMDTDNANSLPVWDGSSLQEVSP